MRGSHGRTCSLLFFAREETKNACEMRDASISVRAESAPHPARRALFAEPTAVATSARSTFPTPFNNSARATTIPETKHEGQSKISKATKRQHDFPATLNTGRCFTRSSSITRRASSLSAVLPSPRLRTVPYRTVPYTVPYRIPYRTAPYRTILHRTSLKSFLGRSQPRPGK